MPIYEYRCASCGFQSEYLQKVSDPILSVCPQCGKATFNKLVTAAGFQLKGSGWYATDFKGAGAGPAAKKSAGDSKAADDATPAGDSKQADSKQADSKPAESKPDGEKKAGEKKDSASTTSDAGATATGS